MNGRKKTGSKPTVKVGDVGTNKRGTKFVVVEYKSAYEVTVKFLDGNCFKRVTYAESVRKGTIDNPYDKTCLGVGYIGEGKYKTSEDGVPTLAHISWSSMMKRSYSDSSKENSPCYRGVIVCSDWHCFNTYAKWFYSQRGWDKGYQLDKDIISRGNKMYSPDACCLVPRQVNVAVKYKYKSRKNMPAGVSVSTVGRFISSLNIRGKSTHIGVYDTQEEAHERYVEAKERYVKNLALEWANHIEWKAFKALMNWAVYPNESIP